MEPNLFINLLFSVVCRANYYSFLSLSVLADTKWKKKQKLPLIISVPLSSRRKWVCWCNLTGIWDRLSVRMPLKHQTRHLDVANSFQVVFTSNNRDYRLNFRNNQFFRLKSATLLSVAFLAALKPYTTANSTWHCTPLTRAWRGFMFDDHFTNTTHWFVSRCDGNTLTRERREKSSLSKNRFCFTRFPNWCSLSWQNASSNRISTPKKRAQLSVEYETHNRAKTRAESTNFLQSLRS